MISFFSSLNEQKLRGSLGLSASSYMDEFILQKSPLSAAPYSMALSALADGLWSLICIFSIIYLFIQKEGCSLMVPRAAIINCWDTWHKLVGLVFWTKASLHLCKYLLSSHCFLISSLQTLRLHQVFPLKFSKNR